MGLFLYFLLLISRSENHKTFIYRLLLQKTGMNSKKNQAIGDLANNVEIAIEQEKKINQDIHNCKGKITSNIGEVIQKIREDKK